MQEALALAEDVAEHATSQGLPAVKGLSYLLLAQAALQEGRPDEARQKGLALAHLARDLPNVFLEIAGLRQVLAAQQKMGHDSAQTAARLRELVAQLDANTRLPDLRPAFETFTREVNTWIETPNS